jgi:hypothetical protein
MTPFPGNHSIFILHLPLLLLWPLTSSFLYYWKTHLPFSQSTRLTWKNISFFLKTGCPDIILIPLCLTVSENLSKCLTLNGVWDDQSLHGTKNGRTEKSFWKAWLIYPAASRNMRPVQSIAIVHPCQSSEAPGQLNAVTVSDNMLVKTKVRFKCTKTTTSQAGPSTTWQPLHAVFVFVFIVVHTQ